MKTPMRATLYLLLFLSLYPNVHANIRDGLVGWWKLDEASGNAIDSSGQGNTGTPTGTTIVNNCARGRCRQFNGSSDYVNIGNVSALKVTGALTITAWVKYSNLTGAAEVIASKYDALSNQRGYLLSVDTSGKLTFNIQASLSLFDATSVVTSTSAWNNGNWHNVVGVYLPSAQLRIYVDGVLASGDAATIPASIANPTALFFIGAINQSTASQFFSGNIDDVRVYNRVLSAQEIKDLYSAGIKLGTGKIGQARMNF